MKTYGTITYDSNKWIIDKAEPHVCIKLKNIFPSIPKTGVVPFEFGNTPEICHDLIWFMSRYPLSISKEDIKRIEGGRSIHVSIMNDMERILVPDYVPKEIILKEGKKARSYQLVAKEMHSRIKRFLLGDDMGLGKTLSAIICCMNEGALPATIVVQSHLTRQWKEAIEEFTNLTVHIIKSVKIYNVPNADVYIFSYHKLSGWVDVFKNSPFRSATFDEVQELRRPESNKYTAAKILSNSVDYCMGLSGTPVINYGNEIHSILSVIKPNCLGKEEDFMREWTTNGKVVNDPKALGGYLRDNYLMLRRTRKDVGRELPPTNKIIHTIDYDHAQADKAADIARMLAIKATTGSFIERGQASRELDAFARHQTGVAKAQYIVEFVKILLDNDEPVLLGIWHRDVYDVIERELREYNPVFYSGEETQKQKDTSKNAFINGESKLLVMSIRSGVGIDGLQNVCNTVVIGELDYSGKIMEQFITRVDRDGQPEQVTVFYLVCDDGSDPVLMDIVGLKNSQAHGIVDPLLAVSEQHSDESRAKLLADYYLKKRNITTA